MSGDVVVDPLERLREEGVAHLRGREVLAEDIADRVRWQLVAHRAALAKTRRRREALERSALGGFILGAGVVGAGVALWILWRSKP